MTFEFWESEVWWASLGYHIGVGRAASFPESVGENLFSCSSTCQRLPAFLAVVPCSIPKRKPRPGGDAQEAAPWEKADQGLAT